MKYAVAAALTAAALGLAGLVGPAAAAERGSAIDLQQPFPNEGYSQYRRRVGGPRVVVPRRGVYVGPRRGAVVVRRGWGGGAAAAAGALAAGALIGGAIAAQAAPEPVYPAPGYPVASPGAADPAAVAWCARRYRDAYDPYSGTFLARDGMRYPCP